MANEGSIKTPGLLTKIKDRLKAAKSYAEADGRKESRERLYQKLKGHYYSDVELKTGGDRIKVENVAGLTYQMRPSYHFRRPQVSVTALTPKFVTERGGAEQTVNNVRNATMMEIALGQEFRAMEVDEEVNAMVQDWICPYEFGAIKVGYGDRTLYSSYEADKVNTGGVWAIRTCPDDIFVDWQAHGKRSIGWYFHAIHKPVQWIKDNKDFNPKARAMVTAQKTPDYLKSRLKNDAAPTPYDMGCVYEGHDLETGQIMVFAEEGTDWLIDPYDFPYDYKGAQFIFLNPMPLNNDFYGRNFISLAEPQIDEINSYRTRMIKIFKRWPVVNFFKKGAWSIEQQRKWEDADDCENLEVNDPAGIDTRTMPSLPADMWRGMEVCERDMEKELGTSAMRRGEVSAVKPTTAQIIEGHGNIRDADIREEVAKVYKKLALKVGDLMIQFYDQPRWVKLTGGMKAPEGMTVEESPQGPFVLYSSNDIAGNYDFDPDVTSMVPINNETKAKVIIDSIAAVPKLPPDVQKTIREKYDLSEVFIAAIKMQGVDLTQWEREEEPDNQDDPWEENNFVLKGGRLQEPHEKEKHATHFAVHSRVLQMLAVNPQDPRFIELARHNQIHKELDANSRQAPQIPGMMQQGPMGSGPMPGQSGMSQGMPGAVPGGPALPPVPPVTPFMGGPQ